MFLLFEIITIYVTIFISVTGNKTFRSIFWYVCIYANMFFSVI